MAYFKAVEHRAKLSGLLVERIHIEKVDLTEALRQADLRIIDVVKPAIELPQPLVVHEVDTRTDGMVQDEHETGGGTGGGTPKKTAGAV